MFETLEEAAKKIKQLEDEIEILNEGERLHRSWYASEMDKNKSLRVEIKGMRAAMVQALTPADDRIEAAEKRQRAAMELILKAHRILAEIEEP